MVASIEGGIMFEGTFEEAMEFLNSKIKEVTKKCCDNKNSNKEGM